MRIGRGFWALALLGVLATRQPASRRLAIKGAHTAACRVDLEDGGIGVLVVALAGKQREPRRLSDDCAPAIEYRLTLYTRPERFEADLARFRALLKTYRIFKSELELAPSVR